MPCVPGAAGLTEYTGKARSHTVQNTGPEAYHLLLVENLRESGWTNPEALQTPGLRVLRENRAFRVLRYGPGQRRRARPRSADGGFLVSGEAMAALAH